MPQWVDKHEIALPAQSVFQFANNLDLCQRWIPAITNIEKQFDGEIQVGSRWLETRKEDAREMTMQLEVFELKNEGPDYLHCAGADLKSMKSFYRFDLSQSMPSAA